MTKDIAELKKIEIKLHSKIAGASAKEAFFRNMILRIEPLKGPPKGMDRFNLSKRKEYRNSKIFIKTIEKYIKEVSSNKKDYIQQLHELKKHLKQETLRDFEQIRRKSKEEIAILPHSTHNRSMSAALPPKTKDRLAT